MGAGGWGGAGAYSDGKLNLTPNIGGWLDDIIGRPALMSDRIHPNGKGYAVMAERFHDVVEPYL